MNWRKTMLLGTCLVSTLALSDMAKVGALVLDDTTGEPVRGVRMIGIFEIKNGWAAWKESPLPNEDFALTDVNGRCRLRGRTNNGGAGVGVAEAPPGYYCPQHGQGWTFSRKNLLGVWQPDNLVATIRLQRVEHPIPLLVKHVTQANREGHTNDIFPMGMDTLRYDLLVGDWLPPAGTGVVEDVVFTRHPREDLGEGRSGDLIKAPSFRDSMTVSFPGEGNGFVEISSPSEFKLKIRMAPKDGYCHDYDCWKMRDKHLQYKSSYDENRCFCFRIRTRYDSEGRMVEAYYGKIYHDVIFVHQAKPRFVSVASPWMSYYLNPTSLDRNLEWDRRTNLFNPGRKIKNPSAQEP